MSRKRARVKVGLLDFEFCASLHIEQSQLDPDVVTKTLKITPRGSHRAGDTRKTPTGRRLKGVYATGYWAVDLEPRDGEDLAQFLARTATELEPAQEFLRTVVDGSGRIECFVGLFATRLCDQIIPSELLLRLGQLGIDLRLDYYDVSKGASSKEEVCQQ